MKISLVAASIVNNQSSRKLKTANQTDFASAPVQTFALPKSEHYKQYTLNFKGNDDLLDDDSNSIQLQEYFEKVVSDAQDPEKNPFAQIIGGVVESIINQEDVDANAVAAKSFITSIKMTADFMLFGAKDTDDTPVFYEVSDESLLESIVSSASPQVCEAIISHPEYEQTVERLKKATNYSFLKIFEAGYSKNPKAVLDQLSGGIMGYMNHDYKVVGDDNELIDIYTLGEAKIYARSKDGQISGIVDARILNNGEEQAKNALSFNEDGSINTFKTYAEDGSVMYEAEFNGNQIKITRRSNENEQINYFERASKGKYIKLN